jgi:iron complex outermembrane receptor protein
MFQRTKICSGLLMAFGSLAVYAQDASQPVQRVEITGSSIKRVDAETALPVQTVNREQIDTLGVTTAEQLLTTLTANSAVGGTTTAQGAGSSTYGEATASLRGLGANKTLVLVNGRRLANYATDGTAVDINSIPLAAVERVEILKDGASGVYGSDAVAGVINFILRKDFKGVEVNAYFGTPTTKGGGKSTKGSVVLGFGDIDSDHMSLMGSLDFSHETAIYGRQRAYARNSWLNDGTYENSATPSGAIRTYDPSGTPGTLNSQGSALGNPLAVGGLSGSSCAANGSAYDTNFGTCRFNSSPFVPLTPDVTRINASLSFHGRVNDTTDFFMEGFLSNAKTIVTEQASPYSVSFLATDAKFQADGVNPAIVLNPTNPAYQSIVAPYLTSIGEDPTQPVTVSYRAFDGGGRVHTDNSTLVHFATGFQGSAKGFDYDAVYSHNTSQVAESTQAGYQNQVALVQLLSGNDSFNPFVAAQTPALAAQIAATNYVGPIINSTLTTNAIDLKATHDLFALSGGTATAAFGASFRKEELDLSPSAAYQSGDVSGYGGAVLPLQTSRNAHSIFAEIYAPFFKSFDADLSIRNDHYPNASSTNPKISLSFTPVREVKFRGSFGTGFREPSLPELYAPQAVATTATFLDPQTNVSGQFTQLTGGNPDLRPEKSKQFSLGIVLEPIKNLSATIDFFHIKVDHEVTTLDPEFIVDQAFAGNSAYTGLVTRDSAGNITEIVSTNLNAGGVTTSGIDVDISWKSAKSSAGVFGVDLNGTWTHKYAETLPDGTVQQSVGNSITADGSPLNAVANGGIIFKWRHALEGNWTYGPYRLSLTQNYQSSYNDAARADSATGTDAVHVKAFQTFDVQAAFAGIKNMTLRLGAKNFTNRQPPQAIMLGQYFQTGYDPSYYDPHGRFVYGSASYKF